jgi:hypothetical protein
MAGSMEGCAYLACEAGDWMAAARLLAGAELVRERTGVPIFNFWVAAQESALREVRSNLSQAEFESISQQGRTLRQEDLTNEALSYLARYSDPTCLSFASTAAKRADGS